MLVDVRTYRIRPSKMTQELELYAKYGLNAQTIGISGARSLIFTARAATSTRSCTYGLSKMPAIARSGAAP